jgi:hypothetical protein
MSKEEMILKELEAIVVDADLLKERCYRLRAKLGDVSTSSDSPNRLTPLEKRKLIERRKKNAFK